MKSFFATQSDTSVAAILKMPCIVFRNRGPWEEFVEKEFVSQAFPTHGLLFHSIFSLNPFIAIGLNAS